MSRVLYTAVGGTGSQYDNGWWKPNSILSTFLLSNGICPIKPEPFIWSTDLDGVHPISYLRKTKARHSDWEAGGAALRYYLEDLPETDRNIISHSHGRQVVLYAASQGLKINKFLDISGPVREDMYLDNLDNIKHMVHVYSNWDYMQILGSLFDRHVGLSVTCPISEKNIKLAHEYGHSGIVADSTKFNVWITENLIGFLKD